jgi:hypothetical protein
MHATCIAFSSFLASIHMPKYTVQTLDPWSGVQLSASRAESAQNSSHHVYCSRCKNLWFRKLNADCGSIVRLKNEMCIGGSEAVSSTDVLKDLFRDRAYVCPLTRYVRPLKGQNALLCVVEMAVSRAVACVISPITGESIIDTSAPCLTVKRYTCRY